MDLDTEQIHSILTESNLPSSINDLKNPTQEYVINLIDTFLRRFHIDVSVIDKPTTEQQEVMLYYEDSNIIDLINLHVAMLQICNRIFVKDLCITDITSPGSKKIRKQAKYFANFILYVNNKEAEIEYQVNELQDRRKMFYDMLEKKEKILGTKNEKALHIAKQLSVKENLISEIQKVKNTIEINNKKHELLMERMADAEKKKLEVMEHLGTYKAQIVELTKSTAELKSQIITSPEEYKKRLIELEEQQSAKIKERETMREIFQDKKHLIEQQKSILNFIQEKSEKLSEVRDTYDRLKEITVQEDGVKKQVDILKTDVTDFQKRLKAQKDQRKEHEVDEIQAQCEKRLSPLRVLRDQLLSEKKLCQENLNDVQTENIEDCSKLDKLKSAIKKLEDETATLLKNCQELYNNEISTEISLREQLTKE